MLVSAIISSKFNITPFYVSLRFRWECKSQTFTEWGIASGGKRQNWTHKVGIWLGNLSSRGISFSAFLPVWLSSVLLLLPSMFLFYGCTLTGWILTVCYGYLFSWRSNPGFDFRFMHTFMHIEFQSVHVWSHVLMCSLIFLLLCVVYV